MFERVNDPIQFYDILTSGDAYSYIFASVLTIFLILLFIVLLDLPNMKHKGFIAGITFVVGLGALAIYYVDGFAINSNLKYHHYASKKPIIINDVKREDYKYQGIDSFKLELKDNHGNIVVECYPRLYSFWSKNEDEINDIHRTTERAGKIVKGRAYKIVTLKESSLDNKSGKSINEPLQVVAIHKVTKDTIYVRKA